ncbi:MAG: hypothetical protein KAH57_11185, partial [Thermoplasmata archaeon]|nr:hypothetical protein [Thermoplasmata archaeon]
MSDNTGVVGFSWTGSPLDTDRSSLVGIIDTPGRYLIILTVFDEAGNTASGNFTIIVGEVPTDDRDRDGIPDIWEDENGLNSTDTSDAVLDPDEDGLTNLMEYLMGSDPNTSDLEGPPADDQDEDGMSDIWENENGLDSSDPADASLDPDDDGYTNLVEYLRETDPNVADRDPAGKYNEETSYLTLAILLLIVVLSET